MVLISAVAPLPYLVSSTIRREYVSPRHYVQACSPVKAPVPVRCRAVQRVRASVSVQPCPRLPAAGSSSSCPGAGRGDAPAHFDDERHEVCLAAVRFRLLAVVDRTKLGMARGNGSVRALAVHVCVLEYSRTRSYSRTYSSGFTHFNNICNTAIPRCCNTGRLLLLHAAVCRSSRQRLGACGARIASSTPTLVQHTSAVTREVCGTCGGGLTVCIGRDGGAERGFAVPARSERGGVGGCFDGE